MGLVEGRHGHDWAPFALFPGMYLQDKTLSRSPYRSPRDAAPRIKVCSELEAVTRRLRCERSLWAVKNDYLPNGRTIIHVNAMSTSVRHFLRVRHGGCRPMSASFRTEIL